MNRRLAAWLAIFGMALNALWPLLATAAPAEFSAPVCSMVGTKSAPASFDMPSQPVPAKSFAPHCPFCAGSSDHSPALASAPVLAIAPPLENTRPRFEFSRSSSSTIHLAAPPRGPPRPLTLI